jgi:phosphoglycerate kinase
VTDGPGLEGNQVPNSMKYALHQLDDLSPTDLKSKNVFVRVDFNVPMRGDEVLDDTRIREALPTLKFLRDAGARLLLASHRGRPKGIASAEFSLEPLIPALSEAVGAAVRFAADCIGPPARSVADQLADGEMCLLENVRFHPGEEAGDDGFAQQLAALAEVYVGEAFGTAHRAHASIALVPRHTRRCAAGRLMAREAEVFDTLLENPSRPFAAVLGGAKVSGKIDTLQKLVEVVDLLFIGGGMANTFLVAQGHELGGSLVEAEKVELAGEVLARCAERGVQVLLPNDLVVTTDLGEQPPRCATVALNAASPHFHLAARDLAVDVGEQTAERLGAAIAGAATLFWNGPMGVFETKPFDRGSCAVAAAVGSCSGFTVIGGGETVAAAAAAGVLDQIDHVSTGGGASLAYLAGKAMPGLSALQRQGTGERGNHGS